MSLDRLRIAGFDIDTTNHAAAILTEDFRAELESLSMVLADARIDCADMLASGGNEAPPTRQLRKKLNDAGWEKRNVVITKTVDDVPKSSTSHEMDHVLDCERGTLALEIEWNNKDPFFDRDLENFQRLHADGAISVGIVVTRGKSLQDRVRSILIECAKAHRLESISEFERLGIKEPTANQRRSIQHRAPQTGFAEAVASMVAGKYGESTTHWNKLQERLARGVGNPCPLLLLGIPASHVVNPGRPTAMNPPVWK